MRVLKIKDVCERTGIGRSRVYELEKAESFPKHIKLGPQSVGWIEHEVDEWIAARMRERSTQNLPQADGPEA